MPPPDGRVLIAFEGPMLTWVPEWTAIDQEYPNLVASYQIDRGRQFELDRTDTGRATVEISDKDGILDPTNTAGPFYGADPSGILKLAPLRQVMLRRYNPVADAWETRFRGFIEDLTYALDPTQKVYRLTMTLVDIFEILSAANMYPGDPPGSGGFGDDPSYTGAPPGLAEEVAGQVWFGPTVEGTTMRARIERLLLQAGIPEDFYVVFSGNVSIQPWSYSPGETVMSAIQETADAELPGVSNVYTDRHGRLCVHGRVAKFDPSAVILANPGQWDFHEFKAGDSAHITLDPAQYAHVREFAFQRALSKVINHALATPLNIEDDQVTAQLVQDTDSIGHYGYRSWQAQGLLTYGGLVGETTPSTSALEETRLFAQYYVDNYKTPVNRVSAISFRSIAPGSPGASESWRLISQVDISDSIQVYVDAPDAGGFVGPSYFVEGVHESCEPANPVYDNVTLSLDLSPRAYFTTDPWA